MTRVVGDEQFGVDRLNLVNYARRQRRVNRQRPSNRTVHLER